MRTGRHNKCRMKKDVEFKCTECGQWLEAPADMAGLMVECPKCNAVIKVPTASDHVPAAARSGPRASPPSDEKSATTEDLKGTTIRINLPPDLGLPAPPKRRFVIRRKT